VRDRAKVPDDLRDKVELIVGDVTDAEQVSGAVDGNDAVVVVLGTRNDLSKRDIYICVSFLLLMCTDVHLCVHLCHASLSLESDAKFGLYIILGPTTMMSQGLRNIINSMKAHNVELISVCLSGNI